MTLLEGELKADLERAEYERDEYLKTLREVVDKIKDKINELEL